MGGTSNAQNPHRGYTYPHSCFVRDFRFMGKVIFKQLRKICRTLNEIPNACEQGFSILKPDTSRPVLFSDSVTDVWALGISLSGLYTRVTHPITRRTYVRCVAFRNTTYCPLSESSCTNLNVARIVFLFRTYCAVRNQ